MFEQATSMDALLLGRRTYEFLADYWSRAPDEIPFTGLLDRVPKYLGGPHAGWTAQYGNLAIEADDVQRLSEGG